MSVKVRGKDEAEFNQRLNEYLPESKVTVTRSGGYHPFGSDYTLKPDIKLAQKLGNYYRVPYELTFKAPTFSSLDQQKVNTLNYDLARAGVQFTVNGGELSVKSENGVFSGNALTIPVSGLSMTDVIVDAVIVGLLLLILVLLFLFRKKIAALARRVVSVVPLRLRRWARRRVLRPVTAQPRLTHRTATRHRVVTQLSPVTRHRMATRRRTPPTLRVMIRRLRCSPRNTA